MSAALQAWLSRPARWCSPTAVEIPYSCSLSAKLQAWAPYWSCRSVSDTEVIGTIKLYEPKKKLFLNINRTLGEGIAKMLANQIITSRFEQQKSLLVTSELKLVQAQINPHFLFNALNTVASVIRTDPSKARDLVLHLSNYFRKNLKRSGELATLRDELDHVQSYLEIEKARFADRLRVDIAIDESLLDIWVPTFTLQPLVENAIKHGLSHVLEGGSIGVRAEAREGTLFLVVEDNAGTYDDAANGDGLGMGIVDKRIKNLYGDGFGLTVECRAGEWTRVSIRLPRQEAAA